MQRERMKKSIYILPNLFTSMNLVCGYYSVIASVQYRFVESAIAILVGAVFDLLDGKIARATNTTSKFGVEYDSLADLITFGMAPALLMFLWTLDSMGRPGWSAALLFVLCGALRLARFNTNPSTSSDFEGLPIPAAAAMNVSVVLFFYRLGMEPDAYQLFLLILVFALSFCMVSSFRYKSLKKVSLLKGMKFNTLVATILVLVAVAAEPSIFLFIVFSLYVVSGPLLSIIDYSSSKKEETTQIDGGF